MGFAEHFGQSLEQKKGPTFKNWPLRKNPIQPPNGVLPIFKPLFLNGSYRNGVCRAFWAKSKSFNLK